MTLTGLDEVLAAGAGVDENEDVEVDVAERGQHNAKLQHRLVETIRMNRQTLQHQAMVLMGQMCHHLP